jgi:hypothetical protein
LTGWKNFTVALEAKGHIDRNPVASESGRRAKNGCEKERPHNRTHKNILLLKEHPAIMKNSFAAST